MFKIYRRFDANQGVTAPLNAAPRAGQNSAFGPNFASQQNKHEHHQESAPSPQHHQSPTKPSTTTKQPQHHSVGPISKPCQDGTNKKANSQKKSSFKTSGFLNGFLPPALYDSSSKKLFGFLSSEDLFLIAVIFLLLEKDGDDNLLMILALIYVLISEYIDLPELGF